MSKEKKLIPELRFPEFEKDGEWQEDTLEGVAYSESSSLALNKIEHKENGFPVYGADSIVGYIDEFQQEKAYISIVKDGSGVGRLNLCQPQSSILGTLACIKSKDLVKFNLDWIYYQMNTIDFTSYKKGSGIPHIYFSDFKKEPIGVPKPQEQQKIASCLSSLDELLAAHNEKLHALKDHKKGLMQNLFPQEGETVPKVRFKEFEGDGEWVEKKLGDEKVSSFVNSKIDSQKLSLENYFSTDNMLSDFGGVKNATKLPTTGTVTKFVKGDILVSNIRPYLKKVWKSDRNGGASNDVLVFRAGSDVSSDFLEAILKNNAFINYVMLSAKGVKMPRGDKDSMLRYSIRVPKHQEQQKIASCLSAVDEVITAQSEEIEQLQQHKKGLMQGLFPKIER